jgi:hypothetical protein
MAHPLEDLLSAEYHGGGRWKVVTRTCVRDSASDYLGRMLPIWSGRRQVRGL